MSQRVCSSCRELLPRSSRSIRRLHENNLARSSKALVATSQTQARHFHRGPGPLRAEGSSPSVLSRFKESIGDGLGKVLSSGAEPYRVFGATKQIYDVCSKAASYSISEEHRKKGTVETTEDGEEIGVGGGTWHDDFSLLPTFSTWSQVTMLHMYLIVVRLRCLEAETHKRWQSNLVDHFFTDAEEKMDVTHGLVSRSIRQKYLRDLFLKWRGLILAFDEGIVKGDAELAAAVWRNLFKGREDVDVRALAAVVSWMRHTLKNLDQMPDMALVANAQHVFRWSPRNELGVVDVPAKEMEQEQVFVEQTGAAMGKADEAPVVEAAIKAAEKKA